MSKIKIAPSIFAANFLNLGEEIDRLEKLGVDYIHYDIMDNHFVPNISFGPLVVETISRSTSIKGDVHLMIDLSKDVVSRFFVKGIEIITVHIEADGFSRELCEFIKGSGFRLGLAIKPKTEVEAVIPYLDVVDMVLVMTVEPGFSGQKLIQETIPKVRKVRDLISSLGREVEIEVDGGVNIDNASELVENGANVLVMGSFFFSGNNGEKVVSFLRGIHEKVS
jgi:ribulose-phosphate 3-epimerase